MTPPRKATILADTMAIKAAHDYCLWNALRNAYDLRTVPMCVQEATQPNSKGYVLVRRTYQEVAAEVTLGAVDERAAIALRLEIGHVNDLDAGERELLAYARTLSSDTWWLCGPDNGTVRAMQMLQIFDRMVSLESVARGAGCPVDRLPAQFRERWLSAHRTQELLRAM